MENQTKPSQVIGWIVLGLVAFALFVGLVFGLFALGKKYKVWAREKDGQAELAEAEWSKKVQIEEAIANLEASQIKQGVLL